MNSLFIKICGITSLVDAVGAAEAGADAIGFNFYERSPRFLLPSTAAHIRKALHRKIQIFGVFVNAAPTFVDYVRTYVGLDGIQFSGHEPAAYVNGFDGMVMKGIHVSSADDLHSADAYRVWGLLLDSKTDLYGGSGMPFKWQLAGSLARTQRVIIAGGLSPENVGSAIRIAAPAGVDVSSGVESAPGRKDRAAMRRFVEEARKAVEVHG